MLDGDLYKATYNVIFVVGIPLRCVACVVKGRERIRKHPVRGNRNDWWILIRWSRACLFDRRRSA